jgi:hypothetical protein
LQARGTIEGLIVVVDESGSKCLPCVFLPDVLCSYRKDARVGVMARCWKCAEFERFECEMDEEDERVMDEIDEERRVLERERSDRSVDGGSR